MGNFFGSIYNWLYNMYGTDLSNFLWGVASPLSTANQHIHLGMTMALISLFVVILYYYIFDMPKLAHWWGWLIFLGINAVANFIVGWQWTLKDLYAGLMVAQDPSTGLLNPLNISESDCLWFGVANMIIASLTFIIFSFISKWWSNNSHSSPF